jgi:dTDP-4-dehydrorhamnose reductase
MAQARIPAPSKILQGQTKLDGENLIALAGCDYLILRTSWVYAARGGNFAKTMLKLARERETLNIIADQFGAPTSAELLADVTAHVIRATLQNRALCGTYHCAAAGETTWFDYARLVFDYARASGHPLALQTTRPIATHEYPTPARRPHNSRLSIAKLQSSFGLHLPAWQTGVTRMLDELFTTS